MTDLIHPERLAKVEAMRGAGRDPFPARGVDATPIEEIHRLGGSPEDPGPLLGKTVTIAGRLLGSRDFGKLIFAPVLDRSGRIQVGLQKQRLGDWWPERKQLDHGDIVGISGELGHTKKGELTLWATEVRLLTKALAQPPEKWHGLTDVEARYRRRYVDLWASEGVREVFVKRSRMLSCTRRFLEDRGFLEVETPTLHPIVGGAAARPFSTHHNALGMELFLRIAPELYLKRLIVGGLERVFELSRNFRNEGLSTRHNPEFTMLELYQAQGDFRHMMELAETLIESLAKELNGTTEVTFRGNNFDLKAPFQRRRYDELFEDINGCGIDDEAAVRARAEALGIKIDSNWGHWKLASEVFEESVEESLTGPIFVTHYPVAISPLSKADPEDGRYAERFELFLGGMELANAFSELNDPQEQQRRFEEQVAAKDPEAAGEVDTDYIQALEFGMPPTGGLGIGMDRLAMVLLGQDSIRDVILFPAMKPRGGDAVEESVESSQEDVTQEASQE